MTFLNKIKTKILSEKKTYFIFLLFFLKGVAETFGEIFQESQFLSFYPPHWFSYLFLISCIVNIFFFFFFSKILTGKNNNYALLVVFIIGLIFSMIPLYKYSWFPFVISVYFGLIYPVFTITCYKLSSKFFSVIEFKSLVGRIFSFYTLGFIISAYCAPVITNHLGFKSLIYFFLFFFFLLLLVIFRIELNSITTETDDIKQSDTQKTGFKSFNDNLTISLFFIMFFSSIAFFSTDYFFKITLAENLKKNELANFLAYFYGVRNIAVFFVNKYLVKEILTRISNSFLFYISPLILFTGLIFTFTYPSLYTYSFLAFCYFISYVIFDVIAFESTLFPLSYQKRVLARTFQSGILHYLGKGVVSISIITLSFVFIQNIYIFHLFSIFLLVIVFPWFLVIKKVELFYKKALEKSLNLTTWDYSKTNERLAKNNMGEMALKILNRNEVELFPLSFSIIKNMQNLSDPLIESMFKATENKSSFVKEKMLLSLKGKNNKLILDKAISVFENEKEISLLWVATNIINDLLDEKFLSFPMKYVNREETIKSVFMCLLIINKGGFTNAVKSLNLVERAINDKRSDIKLAALKVLADISLGNIQDIVISSLKDNDKEIVNESLRIISSKKLIPLIPFVVETLSNIKSSFLASETLAIFPNDKVVPHLLNFISLDKKNRDLFVAIKTILKFRGDDVDKIILEMENKYNDVLKNKIAYESLYSSLHKKRFLFFKDDLFRILLREFENRNQLKILLSTNLPTVFHNDLELKYKLASLNFLYWFGCYTEPSIVFSMIPQFKNIFFDSKGNKGKVHSILETLSSIAPDSQLKKMINDWERKEKIVDKKNEIEKYRKKDPTFNKFYILIQKHLQGEHMDEDLSKLIILRNVEIFKSLSLDVLDIIANESEWKEFSKGDIIFSKGDSALTLYIVSSGLIDIVKNEKKLTTIGKNDCFGEVSVIDEKPRLASAIGKTDGVLLCVKKNTYDKIIEDFPDVLKDITRKIINYLKS